MSKPVTVLVDPAEELAFHERRIEAGLGGASVAIESLQAIQSRELWRGKYDSFEAYCLLRFQIGSNHVARLLNLKLPPRLTQNSLWDRVSSEITPIPSPLAHGVDDDIREKLEEARSGRNGREAVAALVRQEEESILAEAAAEEEKDRVKEKSECLEQLRLILNRAVKLANRVGDLDSVISDVRSAQMKLNMASGSVA